MAPKKKAREIDRKRKLFAIVLFAALFLVFFSSYRASPETEKSGQNVPTKVCFNLTCINVEIADTPELRSRGLMFRESLDEDKGMLFIFGSEGDWGFWMQNTIISLDMIWIGKDLKIVYIETAHPCEKGDCITYSSPKPAKYVLEVNAGFAERNNISPGSKAIFIYS